MPQKYIAPTIAESFTCPHCGAFAHQTWLKAYADSYKKGEFPWWEPEDNIEERINAALDMDRKAKDDLIEHFRKLKVREPFFAREGGSYAARLMNVDFSQCYSCRKFSIWVGCKIVYPDYSHETSPNEDLPSDIKSDFKEAQSIVNASPRGSAALLRLCVQKLCKHLGEKGKNINEDIASLVRKGLDVRIQKALDVVRVIGNEAVHPGQIDLRDDPEIANKLFVLVNVIADATITQPKMIEGLFDSIPDTKRAEIVKRDT